MILILWRLEHETLVNKGNKSFDLAIQSVVISPPRQVANYNELEP